MTRQFVSVVIETINARSGRMTGALADVLTGTLKSLDRQTYPQELFECIVVLDQRVPTTEADEVCRRYPSIRFVSSLASNYLAAKNAGAAAARGEVVAMVDSDCESSPEWLESLVGTFEGNVAAVAGRSYYQGDSWAARTFSIPDFAYILAEKNGTASGFNISNVAFRREVIVSHPFDARIARDGGCYLLFHQLQEKGGRVLYQPRAFVVHGLDFKGLGFVGKHFNRGYAGVAVYQLDDHDVLRGTRVLRRFGAIGLFAITGRRIMIDCLRMLRHRRQIGIPFLALPYFGLVAVTTRCIELVGGLAAITASRSSQ